MAIARMAKVMIVSHRTEAAELLESLQREGICQILNAEEAAISKLFPELGAAAERPRDIEELLNRLTRSIAFLKSYAGPAKGLAGLLSPRTVIDEQSYNQVTSDRQLLKITEQCEQTESAIEKLKAECENISDRLETLRPWAALATPVQEIGQLQKTTSLAALLPARQLEQVTEKIGELGGAIQQVGTADNRYACIIVCLKENINELQKLLRSAEFEPVSFEPMTGTVAELIKQHNENLNRTERQLHQQHEKAVLLAGDLLKLKVLYDHYENLLNREQTKTEAPATQATVILEGWVKKKNFARLEKIVSAFAASSLSKIAPAEDEEIPVEIENKNPVRPFEVITRLYGMPQHFEVDPTVFLAPFFALFFALCLTDAGYGLVIITLMIFLLKKIQGDKKLMWMLGICSAVTIATGALTGGWFGDAIQQFIPALKPLREKMMWFNPLEDLMFFLKLSLVLGYIQILTGLVIALGHNLKRKDYVAAVCDQLTWLVMLNSLVIFGLSKGGVVSPEVGRFSGTLALIPALAIVLFSQRQGRWAVRIGMGAYKLFSTIFYIGDVLSYIRLMALGMVTAGLAMAVNIVAGIARDMPRIILNIPYVSYGIGIVGMVLVLIFGHGFNVALSGLSAFVHTLRLQYVEFFPKFLLGGGKLFEPLSKKYRHIYIKREM